MDPAEQFAELVGRPGGLDVIEVPAALIGASLDPAGDVEEVARRLHALAGRCRPTFESIRNELFASGLLGPNRDDYGDPRNSYLHEVLRRGVGLPITLTVCAMAVGRHRGVPVRCVGLPGHVLMECDGQLADPFDGGRLLDRGDIEALAARTVGDRPFDDRWLTPLGHRHLLIRMLNNLRQVVVAMDDPVMAHAVVRLRSAFGELSGERDEWRRMMRHWN